MVSRGIQKSIIKGATRGKKLHDMDNLLKNEEVIDLASGLVTRDGTSFMERGLGNCDGRAYNNMRAPMSY